MQTAMTTLRPAIHMHLITARPVVSKPIRVKLTIANETSAPLTIADPQVGPPPADLHWAASGDAYRVGVLTSLGLMRLALAHANAAPLASKAPAPWVTLLLGQRVLQMHESVTFDFDLDELFEIDSPGHYLVSARYGKGATAASAEMPLEVFPLSGQP